MCLWIKFNQEENERDLKKWFGSRKKFAYVYKILRKYPDEDVYRSEYHSNFKWDFKKKKTFQIVRSLKPTKEELRDKEINKGLHIYTSLEEAKYHLFYSNSKIIKFRVDKEDIIAIENEGRSHGYENFREAVCKKLTFVKIVED
jgi:hypothetical protein